ncbi:hypothetical protein CEXT_179301 [Caerostris extrusa]|uniref:Reverse transcriptase zinc-binding domain-containing protein n=1 Tax=Caerostris extrusa TaxID=172846 RepID=A0AAV4QW01_CAEEX|nr:hypothetical protein CEXT_179301 [Caerostris extrusa]
MPKKVNLNRLHGNYFINQIITGHVAIAIYQHKSFSSSPACNCGKEVEDRDHIIFKCELRKEIRGKHLPNTFNNKSCFGSTALGRLAETCTPGLAPGFFGMAARGCCCDSALTLRMPPPLGAADRVTSHLCRG